MLDAGSVFATLSGDFQPAGFVRFGAAMRTAQGQMETGEKRMRTAADRTSASLHAMGQAAKVGAGAGIVALGAVIATSVKKAADFEAQLSSLGAVSNATGKQMAALRKQAMDAGAATKFSALEAAAAQTELAKGGLSVSKILSGGLKGALALAAAGEMDLAQAASTTANSLNLFGLNGRQATHVADAMATAANSTTAEVADFAMALTQGGAAAKAAGLSFDQTMVALEALAAAGVRGSDAGTSLKAALTQMAAPSEKAAEKAKQLGIEFFKANGTMKTMPQMAAMLSDKLSGLTKQQRLQAATTLVGTDGMRALLALYDAGAPKLTRYGNELAKQGTAAETAAKKQDNLKGRLENLQGSLETAAIALGSELLPMFEKLAVAGTEWVNEMVQSGQVEDFAQGVEQAFRVIGEVISDLVGVAKPVAGVFADIADAIGGVDATKIEAVLAAFLGFKAVNTVVPMVQTLAAALGDVALNARTAPTLAAFFKSLPVSPLTLAAGAAGALGAALVILGSRESTEARFARENAEAHRAQAKAMQDVLAAERIAAGDALSAQQADLSLAQAKRDLAAAADEYGKKSPQYKQALLDVRQATLDQADAHKKSAAAIREQNQAASAAVQGAARKLAEAQAEVNRLDEMAAERAESGANVTTDPSFIRARGEAMKEITRWTEEYIQALARQEVTEASRNRLMQASTQITQKNQQGIAMLIDRLKGVPEKVQSRLLVQDQDALARAGRYADVLRDRIPARVMTSIISNADSARSLVQAFRAVLAGVPERKVIRILQNAPSARAEVDQLRGSINALSDKTVTITTRRIEEFQSVRGGGTPRRAQGGRTSGPELALIGEGPDPVEWVIPRDPRYRARATDLLLDAAKSILPGYKRGTKKGGKPAPRSRAPKPGAPARRQPKTDRYVPPKLDPLSLPVDDLEARTRDAAQALQDARQTQRNGASTLDTLNASIRDIQRRQPATPQQKQNKADDLARAQEKKRKLLAEIGQARRDETRRKADLAQRQKELGQARAYANRIGRQQDLADIAADAMGLANSKDDQKGYDAALAKRTRALVALRKLLEDAQGHVPKGSKYWRELQKALGRAAIDVQDAQTAKSDAQQDAEQAAAAEAERAREEAERAAEPRTFTKAEEAELAARDRAIALATLTQTLDDDRTAAASLESFLSGVLTSALADPASRGGDDAITEIAGRVKQARDNLASLTSSTPTAANDNPDLQAQLDQSRERERVARDEARIANTMLTTLGGSGDIGAGAANARAAVIFQSYVPPSPREALRLADYVVGGISYQPSKTSPRESLGV